MAKKKVKVIEKSRRPNGEGSIYQRKDGLWTGAITITQTDGNFKRKIVYGHSETEVSKKLIEITGKMNIIKNSQFANKTFGELFLDWLLVFKKASVTPRTFESNIRNYNLHIKPFISNMRIEDVTTPVIQQIINEMLSKGLATATVKKVKFIFNQFFEYATECELVSNNPTQKIKIRSRDMKMSDKENIYKAIPPEVRMDFLSKLNNHELLKPLCMTGMFAGLRMGELLALRWENIDIKNKTINVKCGITQIPLFDEKGKVLSRKTVIGDTKTACSVREVPIPDILSEALKDWKKCQWVKQQLSGVDLLKPNAIVFCNTDGTVRTYAGTRHIFDRFKRKYGFDKYHIHFHTLRHTYSNMLFEANENPKIIQALLGHKSVKTTLTVYNSVDKSYYRQATDKLNELFNQDKMAEYKVLEKKKDIPALNKPYEEMDKTEETDPEILMLEKLLAEKKARKKEQNEEM